MFSIATRISLVQTARLLVLLVGAALLIVVALDHIAALSGQYFILGEKNWLPLAAMDELPRSIIALLAILIPFLYLLTSKIAVRLERGIVGRGTDGEQIRLSPEAIERAVVRDVREKVSEVVRIASCCATQGKNAPSVRLSITVSDASPVPAVRKKATDAVKETLERLIGFSDSSQVYVKVTGLSAGKGARPGGDRPRKKRRPDGAARPATSTHKEIAR